MFCNVQAHQFTSSSVRAGFASDKDDIRADLPFLLRCLFFCEANSTIARGDCWSPVAITVLVATFTSIYFGNRKSSTVAQEVVASDAIALVQGVGQPLALLGHSCLPDPMSARWDLTAGSARSADTFMCTSRSWK